MNSVESSPVLSIVLPVFNEVRVLGDLMEAIAEAVALEPVRLEVIFVDDGSTDGSGARLDDIASLRDDVRVLHFVRNFGHQAAVQAGLAAATGDAVVLMDSDMQDDPRAIPRFLEAWRNGADVVYAVRTDRKEAIWKRTLFVSFYRVLNAIADQPIPRDAGNFSLLDRSVVDQINSLPERERYFPGLRQWVGFRQEGLPVERLARYDDHPRVSLRGLFRLAQTAVFSFSTFPLRIFYGIAAASFVVFLGVGLFALYHRLLTGEAIPGWTSQLCVAAFFGMINALGVGILGEYVFRIYDQVRGRPLFIVRERGPVSGRRAFGDSVEERTSISTATRRRMRASDAIEPSVVGGEPS